MKTFPLYLFLLTSLLSFHTAKSQITAPATHLCVGATLTLTDPTPSGVWSSSNPASATIGSGSGIVTGLSAGTTTISYVVGAATSTLTLTINPIPSLLGVNTACVGLVGLVWVDTTSAGTWASSDTTVIHIDSAESFFGSPVSLAYTSVLATGTTNITFTSTAGCTAIKTVTVYPALAPITGSADFCIGASITVADASPGGKWISSDTSVAVVDSATGVVTGKSANVVTIEYAAANGCYSFTDIHVLGQPDPGTIAGPDTVCIGNLVSFYDLAATGTWTSGNTALATIDGLGYLTGISPGVLAITFTATNICGSHDTTRLLTIAECISGVAHVVAAPQLVLEPNPNNGTFLFNLVSPIDEPLQVTITNILGQKVNTFATTANKQAWIHLPGAGLYFLSAYNSRSRYDVKVMVE